jgi:hypothetical protein
MQKSADVKKTISTDMHLIKIGNQGVIKAARR